MAHAQLTQQAPHGSFHHGSRPAKVEKPFRGGRFQRSLRKTRMRRRFCHPVIPSDKSK